MYRIFARIINKKIQNWMEDQEILGEMQHGYRTGKRGDDCLFIITAAIEMARAQKKGLLATYLDCTKAYDKVCRAKLWAALDNLGLHENTIELLKILYRDNTVILKTREGESKRVTTPSGLKQGCALSPTLFLLYIADLEERLLNSEKGFEVRVSKNIFASRKEQFRKIPGLLFADDILLLSHSWKDMETLLEITSNFGEEKNLIFNPAKSAVVVYSSDTVDKERKVKIQGKEIPRSNEYKYLGITLGDGPKYLETQEKIWSEKARKAIQKLHAKALWKFNRFETSKIQWKATGVPTLTYCNTVTVMSPLLRKQIETAQRQAAKWALGNPAFNIANEFLEGELGWATFEEREARSKLTYFKRVENMPNNKWPKMVYQSAKINNIMLAAVDRLGKLKQKFNCQDETIEESLGGQASTNTYKKYVYNKIDEVVLEEWKDNMESKSSLTRYRKFKQKRGTIEHIYDNSRGSTLLAEARAGFLKTRKFRSRFEEIDPHCSVCGRVETLEHVILKCHEVASSDDEILIKLGLHEESTGRIIEETKRTLERWEKRSK